MTWASGLAIALAAVAGALGVLSAVEALSAQKYSYNQVILGIITATNAILAASIALTNWGSLLR